MLGIDLILVPHSHARRNLQFEPEFKYINDGGLTTLIPSADSLTVDEALTFRQKAHLPLKEFIVSAGVRYGDWVIIGSPFSMGVSVCHDEPKPSESDPNEEL